MRIPLFFHAVVQARLRTATVVLFTLAALVSSATADMVYLPDGFVLQGKIQRENTTYADPISGQPILIARLNGFFMIDDGARRVIFSQNYVQEVDDRNAHAPGDFITLKRPTSRPPQPLRYAIQRITDITPFDAKWERDLSIDAFVKGQTYHITLPQRLVELTPYYARLDGLRRYNWVSCYLTQELGPDAVLKLMATHPDLALKGQTGDDVRRWKKFRFLIEATWYDLAQKELDGIRKDLPDQKDKIEQAEDHLQKLRAERQLEFVELAHTAGRHRLAQQALVNFPTKGADDRVVAAVRGLRGKYTAANANLAEARRFLDELPKRISDDAARQALTPAAKVIRASLNFDNADRLDTFVRFAAQAERLAKEGKKPKETPERIVSLAISGWLLGSSSAQLDVAFAQRLWETRQFVLDYQKTRNAGARRDKLLSYQRGRALAFDELAQLIRYLPPPEPEDPLPKPGTELQTDLPGQTQSVKYLVQLPEEYTHSRPYPVLIVLHQVGEKPFDMLRRWSAQAALHGYILVAPEWETSLGSGYDFTPEAQAGILNVLRDLRRRFQVDSDRVFLFGYGEGGVAAYDVGLGHPDQFAGMVLMCTRPRYFARRYWSNAQYLPLYIVDGDRDGDAPESTRNMLEHWVPHGYPALYVEYKGRGADWFPAEIPFAFDWMDCKKRPAAFPELGRSGNGGALGDEFQSLRPCDNRFYWLSSDAIDARRTSDPSHWNWNVPPATFQARIGEGNYVLVNARGMSAVTVWLGSGMVDFSKPVLIQVQLPGLKAHAVNRVITPDLGTLVEDFYERGDRQRVFWARVDFRNLR